MGNLQRHIQVRGHPEGVLHVQGLSVQAVASRVAAGAAGSEKERTEGPSLHPGEGQEQEHGAARQTCVLRPVVQRFGPIPTIAPISKSLES